MYQKVEYTKEISIIEKTLTQFLLLNIRQEQLVMFLVKKDDDNKIPITSLDNYPVHH